MVNYWRELLGRDRERYYEDPEKREAKYLKASKSSAVSLSVRKTDSHWEKRKRQDQTAAEAPPERTPVYGRLRFRQFDPANWLPYFW